MAGEFIVQPLGTVAKVRSGYAFKSEDMGTVGLPVIKIKNVVPPTVDITDCERVPEEVISTIPRVERFELKEGDILIAMTGATVGKVGKFPHAYERHFLNQRVGKVYLTEMGAADYRYIYYILSQDTYVRQMFGIADGSAQANISGMQIESLEVPLPPLAKQKAIAAVLGALDDKIELNQRMNATLEAMAQMLFKSWFVDFDPVQAKLDGFPSPVLDPATAALFPSSFDETALGYIPKGWKVGKIQDCCVQIQNGGTPRRNEPRFWDGGTIPWLASGEVRQSIITTTESYITEEGLAESTAKWVPAFSTVVALYGATAGQVAFTSTRLTTNQAVCALIPKQAFAFFNYLTMRRSTTEMENKAVGSAQQNISKGIVEEIQVVLPPPALAERFTALVSPLFERWTFNLHQSRTLAALRDTLLPKLLNGELSVDKLKEGLVA